MAKKAYALRVDEEILKFTGKVKIFESQDAAVEAISADKIKEGDIVLIVYEGPKGGPGMQEMLYPTAHLKGKGLGNQFLSIAAQSDALLHVVDASGGVDWASISGFSWHQGHGSRARAPEGLDRSEGP